MRKYRVKRHAVTQPLDPSYRLIPLTRKQNAIVDAKDYDWLNQWNWNAHWSKFTKSFYATRAGKNREFISMHQDILKLKRGEQGDHRNHDTLDNRRNNLRKCTHAENSRNRRKRSTNTSGFTGVTWHKGTGKWAVQIYAKNRKVSRWLGLFSNKEAAAHAYDAAAKIYFGQFAVLNFPHPTNPAESC